MESIDFKTNHTQYYNATMKTKEELDKQYYYETRRAMKEMGYREIVRPNRPIMRGTCPLNSEDCEACQ